VRQRQETVEAPGRSRAIEEDRSAAAGEMEHAVHMTSREGGSGASGSAATAAAS
jgi:hypothetical protein